jgi:cytochrome c oxidase subunit 4
LSWKTYLSVFIAVLLLALLTTFLDFVDLGPLHTPIALAIAAAKATLVAMFFMGLIHSPPLMRIAVGAGVLWLAILVMLTLGDYLTRGWVPVPGK